MGDLIEHGSSNKPEDVLFDSNGNSQEIPSSSFDLEFGDGERLEFDTPENRRFLLEYFATGDLWKCAKSAGLTSVYTRSLVKSEWFRTEYQSLRQAHAAKKDKELENLQRLACEKLSERIRYGDEVVLVIEGELVKTRKDVSAQQLMTILDKVTKHRMALNNPMNSMSRNNPDSDALPIEHAAHPANPAHMADPQKQMEMAKRIQEERLKRMQEVLGGGQTVEAEFSEVVPDEDHGQEDGQESVDEN